MLAYSPFTPTGNVYDYCEPEEQSWATIDGLILLEACAVEPGSDGDHVANLDECLVLFGPIHCIPNFYWDGCEIKREGEDPPSNGPKDPTECLPPPPHIPTPGGPTFVPPGPEGPVPPGPSGPDGPGIDPFDPFPDGPPEDGPPSPVTGNVNLTATDIWTSGFAHPWGHSREWSNAATFASSGVNGEGWFVHQQPVLVDASPSEYIRGIEVNITLGATDSVEFRWNFSSEKYQPRFMGPQSLTFDPNQGPSGTYIYQDGAGNTIRFHDTDAPDEWAGSFISYTDIGGNVTEVTGRSTTANPSGSAKNGAITEITRTDAATGVSEVFSYTFGSNTTHGPDNGWRIHDVEHTRVDGSVSTLISETEYAYYPDPAYAVDGSDSLTFGAKAGNLKSAITRDGDGVVLDRNYYRYTAVTTDFTPLSMVFNGASLDRLEHDLAAQSLSPFTASDSAVEDYADFRYEYYSPGSDPHDPDPRGGRVSAFHRPGNGSSASDGIGTTTYDYEFEDWGGTSAQTDDWLNTWTRKTISTHEDGTTVTYWSNPSQMPMLQSVKEPTSEGGDEWLQYWSYERQTGMLMVHAQASAISGYDETERDLLIAGTDGSMTYLHDSAGLVTYYDYYWQKTGSDTTPGGAAGLLKSTVVAKGEKGALNVLRDVEYFVRSSGVSFVANSTVYRDGLSTSSGLTTEYEYEWYSGVDQVKWQGVVAPVVSTANNGPGGGGWGYDEQLVFGLDGRVQWRRDAGGFLHYMEHEPLTGAVIKTIEDVDTAQTTTFDDTLLPTTPVAWTTPTGGGLHLTYTATVDQYGRILSAVDPSGTTSYTVYNDAADEIRTYAAWGEANVPTVVVRADYARGYTEILRMSATPTVVGGEPTGTEAISSVLDVARSTYNIAGQHLYTDEYFDVPSTYTTAIAYGTEFNPSTGTGNYYRSELEYGRRGWLERAIDPTGTIYETEYDALGRTTTTKIGVTASSLATVAALEYDNDGVGDGNLTLMTVYAGGSAAARVTKNGYDWRNRLIATKSGVTTTETTDVQRPLTIFTLDNFGLVTVSETYDGDGFWFTSTPASNTTEAGLLRYRSSTDYDERLRAFRTSTYSVDPDTGDWDANERLYGEQWYGKRGEVVKATGPGGLASKFTYDGAGRQTASYLTDASGDSSWSDALNVTGDIVLEQSEVQYDADSNVTLMTSRQRFHDAATSLTGGLGTPTSGVPARVSYAGYWYDELDRVTDAADWGTNGATAITSRPASVPSRGTDFSYDVLVASYEYGVTGQLFSTTDFRGVETRYEYDDLARMLTAIEAYDDGTPSDDNDRITRWTYNANSQVQTMTADLPAGQADQTTTYNYNARITRGDDLDSNGVLVHVTYPVISGIVNTEEYEVNRLGEQKTLRDRNQTTHTYTYDVLGRLTSDEVTILGSGVNGAVREMTIAYNSAGWASLLTRLDGSSVMVNQIERSFNGLGQLVEEWQEHDGAVDGSTPSVGYTYSDMVVGTSAVNHSRPTSMVYPDGTVLDYTYATGLDDTISRLSGLQWNGVEVETYDYLGLSSVVERDRPAADHTLTFVKQGSETNGAAGDQYTGLDRFGRVIDQRWTVDASGGGGHLDRFQYGYDRNSNRLYKENLVDATKSELYHDGSTTGYDDLNRLGKFSRGTLNGTKDGLTGSASRSQDWNLDALGNWNSVTDEASVTQTRTHDVQNRIATVSNATAPTYSPNGEMTGDEEGQKLIYDAWGELVKVTDAGDVTISEYLYDALGRRINQNDQAFYYSQAWQVLEERDATSTPATTSDATDQYVWSPVYVDAMVLRDRNFDGHRVTDFGDNGVKTSDFGGDEVGTSVAVTSSGQILVAGTQDGDFLLSRYNDDGTLDTTFGASSGYTVFDLGGTETVGEMAILSTGKILLAGGSSGDFAFARFNADGTIDTTFGTGGSGKKIVDLGGSDEAVAGLRVQSDGKIVVAGSMGGDWLVARFTSAANPALDTTFSSNGWLTTDLLGYNDEVHALLLQSDGKIVVGGSAGKDSSGGHGFGLARYTTSGVLDTSFSGDGIVTDNNWGSAFYDLAIQSDGKVVAAGYAPATSGGSNLSVRRFTTSGGTDLAFGGGGVIVIQVPVVVAGMASGVSIDSAGRVNVAGTTASGDAVLTRQLSTGALDSSFAGDGISYVDLGSSADALHELVLMPDGSLLAVGETDNGTDTDIALVRIRGDADDGMLYAIQDANFNLTALVDATTGATVVVVERYLYDPHGLRTVLDANWSNDADGISDVGFEHGHQGLRYDPDAGLYHNRWRDYDPALGRFVSQDPLGYVDGASLYQYVAGNPASYLDPSGLRAQPTPMEGNSEEVVPWVARQRPDGRWVLDYIFGHLRMLQWTPPQEFATKADALAAAQGLLPEAQEVVERKIEIAIETGKALAADAERLFRLGILIGTLQTALSLVPGGAAADKLQQGDYKGALQSALIDSILALSGAIVVSNAAKIGKALAGSGLGRAVHGGIKDLTGKLCFVEGTLVLTGGNLLVEIETIRVGDRLATDGGLSEHGTVASDPNHTEVDEATFRRVSLYVEGTLSDGSVDPWHLETLVPLSWIDAHDVDPGEWIAGDWLPYTDFAELGVTGEVVARVEGIFASPVITEGPGRVVLSTIEHLGEDLYELTLHSADGTTDALGDVVGVTAPHRFYSESRGWVAAAELEEGEVLRGHDGPLTVTQIGRIEGTRPVYNFSVEADHVYYAGVVSALTHNSYLDRIGFAKGTAQEILKNLSRVDHAGDHLIKSGVIRGLNLGSKEARAAIRSVLEEVLENPSRTFNHVIGGQRVRGFVGYVDGQRVWAFVAKEAKGKLQAGDLITAFVPSWHQWLKYMLR